MDGFHKLNHWNYTQMIKSKPSLEQREKENLVKFQSTNVNCGVTKW